jgi:polar amino acid transport system substrate-binding protein
MRFNLHRRQTLMALGGSAAAAWLPPAAAQEVSSLEKIRAKGSISIAVYNGLPPFHANGAGIDVRIAQELAKDMGVKLSLLPFNADENMGDDLRNLVWKGHYLGFGPADVLMHVPVDKPLMDAEPKVLIFAPYFRESIVMARNLDKIPKLEGLADLKKEPVAVAGQTLSGWLMIGADNGAYQEQLQTKFDDGTVAARALLEGKVSAAVGQYSELHSVLKTDPRFAIEPLPVPRAPRSAWPIGMAVKKEATELAKVLQASSVAMAQDGRLRSIFAEFGVPWRAA